MLILSRRTNEKIVFPTINAVVQVISMKAGTVRLGIDAPGHVPVYREEVLDRHTQQQYAQSSQDAVGNPVEKLLQPLLHQINNRLNGSTIGLALLRRQLEMGMNREMGATLSKIEQEITGLRQIFDGLSQSTSRAINRRRRALLVEDDPNECELLAGFLRMAGMEVSTAGDGADAIDYLRTNGPPDLMLVDMILPRCDGPTTVRTIRQNPANNNLKIFGVTGADYRRYNLPEGPEGVDRWFPKPLNPEKLLREIVHHLDKQG